jgi:hypothetical protein
MKTLLLILGGYLLLKKLGERRGEYESWTPPPVTVRNPGFTAAQVQGWVDTALTVRRIRDPMGVEIVILNVFRFEIPMSAAELVDAAMLTMGREPRITVHEVGPNLEFRFPTLYYRKAEQ